MEPRDVTRELLKAVEVESGFPVHVREDANLATVASVRLARDPLPAHMISYRPDGKRVLDYLICYQCGFVLRHFAAPPEARGDARSTVAGEAAVHELVRDLAGPEAAAQAELTHLYLGGLITHVRSIPVGLRVAAWLAEHYPVLREQQEEAVLRELAEAQVSLEPRIKEVTPEAVYRPTQAINAAYALFWAERWGRRELAAPYRFAGHDAAGGALLKLWHEVPAGPEYDRALVDAWGAQLGILGWYAWAPYQAPR